MITVDHLEHRRGHGLEKILLLLQNDKPTDESRLTMLLIRMANLDFDISKIPQLRVINLLSSYLPASNGQGEEILLIHLLMTNLNSGPFSDLWQLGTHERELSMRLVVIADDDMCQDHLLKVKVSGNKTPRCLPISCTYTKAHGKS